MLHSVVNVILVSNLCAKLCNLCWLETPLKSVTHGHCDARPMVTFPAAERHRTLGR